jgi:hypothetical protein
MHTSLLFTTDTTPAVTHYSKCHPQKQGALCRNHRTCARKNPGKLKRLYVRRVAATGAQRKWLAACPRVPHSFVLLQTEMDKSFETGNLFWTVMKGICYGKAAQAV